MSDIEKVEEQQEAQKDVKFVIREPIDGLKQLKDFLWQSGDCGWVFGKYDLDLDEQTGEEE